MRRRVIPGFARLGPLLGLAALAPAPARCAEAAFAKTACVRVERTVDLSASVGDVWVAVTSAEGFGALTGFTVKPGATLFERVGDAMPARIGEDDGQLVCTAFVSGKELRVSWEPQNGSYLCHKWLRLRPTPTGTRLIYVDRYTDDQTATADQTARQVASATDQAIGALKRRLEAH